VLPPSRAELESAVGSRQADRLQDMAGVKHVLTHKDLYLHPVRLLTSAKLMASQEEIQAQLTLLKTYRQTQGNCT